MNDIPQDPTFGFDASFDPTDTNPDVAALNDAQIQGSTQMKSRLAAILNAARYHGMEMDLSTLRLNKAEESPSPPVLVDWLREAGLWARGAHLNFRQLLNISDPGPLVLLLNDGSAALAVGRNGGSGVVFLRDPLGQTSDPVVYVDELRLKQVWSGAVLMVRAARQGLEGEPPFDLSLLIKLVGMERKIMKDIAIGSITITVLSLVPIFVVMQTINTAIEYKSINTLILVTMIMVICVVFECILTWGRKIQQAIAASRIDSRLNLMIFDRLLALPIEFFEREQAGNIAGRISQVRHVREFLTGKLMTMMIDVIMVALILPILFFMNATLAWTILIASACIALIIAIFLRPMGRMTGRIIEAENAKNAILIESLYGIRTVKALAIEPLRAAEWDRCVAEATTRHIEAVELGNWPATLVMPFQRYCGFGVMLLGAWISMTSTNPLQVGSLFGFMMLGGRVAGPLASLAGLMEDVQEANAAIGQVASVLNRPTEKHALTHGLRPVFQGAIEFNDVTFKYEGTKTPALDKMTFSIPAGTMLGLVGRSGSGKSTITRLLQGINRDYQGAIKIDGNDMREINLRHLRKNFGMVLQDNFLFRGSVRENIIAGRPGLSFEDAVQAARLAGAEEFIERLPNGYDTFIQEGSPNLSGGQKQRLAIARAVISNPRVLILDEATSALDPESEALVNANLLRIAKGRTMVIVSHRLSSLLDCDLIMVLDRGRTMDIGTHHELVERCAIYRHLWLQQNRHMDSQGKANAASAPTII
jgi:HlyB family type I secretion system ABC transporter